MRIRDVLFQTLHPKRAFLLALAVVGCDSASDGLSVTNLELGSRPFSVTYVSGSGQEARPGEVLPDFLVVRALTPDGEGVSGVDVSFSATAGGGALAPASARTDADGYARSAWTLGAAGVQSAEARASRAQKPAKNLRDSLVVFAARVAAEPRVLEVSPPSASLEEGDTLRLEARLVGADGVSAGDVQVSWESTDTTVATLGSSGLLTARREGSTRAVARTTVDGVVVADTAGVEVFAPTSSVTTVSVSPEADTLLVGATSRFQATVRDGAGNVLADETVSWATGAPDVATVDESGVVTARAPGRTTVTVASGGARAEATVWVVELPAPERVDDLRAAGVTDAAVTLRWTQVDDGTGGAASYALRYGPPTFDWDAAADTEIALSGTAVGDEIEYTFTDLAPDTEYRFQLVSFRGALGGDAVFGARSDIAGATTEALPVARISVSPASHTFTSIGDTARLVAVAYDRLGGVVEDAELSFTSSDSSITSVDAMGRMTARAVGTASILVAAVCCDASATVDVEVVPPADGAYHVSTAGSDAAAGTRDAPWRTIGYALTQLRPGDTLLVRGGEYVENIQGPNIREGRPDARIVVAAYPGERPVLRGLLWLYEADYWTVDGLNVTWAAGNDPTDHMVKMTDGVGWVYENSEIWGARSFAGILVFGSIPGEPSDWAIRGNCVHDVWTDPIHHTNGDHNLYINTGTTAGPGVIERNILFNAPNGQNVKLGYGSSEPSPGDGAANVTVRYNTMYSALKNLMVTDESHDITIERNIVQLSAEGYALRAYRLNGSNNVMRDNVFYEMSFLQYADDGYGAVTDGGGNLLPLDPEFDAVGCSGFRPADETAQRYGRYAG